MKDSSSSASEKKKELRGFGLTVGVAFILLGFFLMWRASRHGMEASPVSFVLQAIGALLAMLGLAAPGALLYPYRGWSFLGEKLAWINTRILLALVFAIFIVPLGLFFKLIGRDLLGQRYDSKASTYWIEHKMPGDAARGYERQF